MALVHMRQLPAEPHPLPVCVGVINGRSLTQRINNMQCMTQQTSRPETDRLTGRQVHVKPVTARSWYPGRVIIVYLLLAVVVAVSGETVDVAYEQK